MAMTMVPISEGVHYIATAELESALTAWLMLRGISHTSSMSLGSAGKSAFTAWLMLRGISQTSSNLGLRTLTMCHNIMGCYLN